MDDKDKRRDSERNCKELIRRGMEFWKAERNSKKEGRRAVKC